MNNLLWLLCSIAMFSSIALGFTTSRSSHVFWSKSSRLVVRSVAASLATESNSTTLDASVTIKVPKKFVPYPFQYHEERTCRVVSLTNLGLGICRIPIEENEQEEEASSKEWVVMVPNVIPGELVQVRIYRNYKSYSDADLVQVLEPSPDRIEPLCKLSNVCGGCQYQHMNIQAQRDWKRQHVEEVFERVGELRGVQVSPTVGTDEIFHYRSKITPHYERPQKLSKNSFEISDIGFKQKTSRRLVDVPYCHIATEAINGRLETLRAEKRLEASEGLLRRPKRGATLLLREADEGVVTDHNTYVTTTVAGLTFRFLAGNFFQNNPFVLPEMVKHVVSAATQPSPQGAKMTHLIDCYCGSGLFCLSASSEFDVCVGIEVNDKAVDEATANAKLNNVENCAFVAASAEAIFESNREVFDTKVKDFCRDSTVVVVDPPRKGCSEEFLDQLYEYSPQRVVYMSCDPATQARDAKGLVQHGYEITSVLPFDLFPQTRHIENLVVFEKKK